MNQKQKPLFVLALLLVALLAALTWVIFGRTTDKAAANGFGGRIDKIEGNVIYANGALLKDGKPFFADGRTQDIMIKVSGNAKMTKTEIIIPSGDREFNTNDLEQNRYGTDLAAIVPLMDGPGIGIEADFSSGKNDTYNASAINFRVPIFKDQPELQK